MWTSKHSTLCSLQKHKKSLHSFARKRFYLEKKGKTLLSNKKTQVEIIQIIRLLKFITIGFKSQRIISSTCVADIHTYMI